MVVVRKANSQSSWERFEKRVAAEASANNDDNTSTPVNNGADQNPIAVEISLTATRTASTSDESTSEKVTAIDKGIQLGNDFLNQPSPDDVTQSSRKPFLQKKKRDRYTPNENGGASSPGGGGGGGEADNSSKGNNEAVGDVPVPQLPPIIPNDGYASQDKKRFAKKPAKSKKKCNVKNCTSFAQRKGVCIKHGAQVVKKSCSVPNCTNISVRGGVCVNHGAQVKSCNVPNCTNISVRGGVCIKHGAQVVKKKCSVPNCTNNSQKGGVCFKHGAQVKRCKVPNCTNNSKKGGVCIKHGAQVVKKKCSVPNCTKFAQKGGVCVKHGDGAQVKRCNVPNEENASIDEPAAKKMKVAEDLSLSNAADAGMKEAEDLTLSDLMATATQVALV